MLCGECCTYIYVVCVKDVRVCVLCAVEKKKPTSMDTKLIRLSRRNKEVVCIYPRVVFLVNYINVKLGVSRTCELLPVTRTHEQLHANG